jgi:hypothetical protein
VSACTERTSATVAADCVVTIRKRLATMTRCNRACCRHTSGHIDYCLRHTFSTDSKTLPPCCAAVLCAYISSLLQVRTDDITCVIIFFDAYHQPPAVIAAAAAAASASAAAALAPATDSGSGSVRPRFVTITLMTVTLLAVTLLAVSLPGRYTSCSRCAM